MHCYGIVVTNKDEIFIAGNGAGNPYKLSPTVVDTVRASFIKKDIDAVILLSRVVDDSINKQLNNILTAKQIKNGLFFIEDVLNITVESNINHLSLDTSNIERYPDKFRCPEIEVILDIVNSSSLTDYMIFSGEDNAQLLEKKYNIKIYYYDWFLLSCFSNPSAYVSPWHTRFEKKLVCFNRRYEPHRSIISALLHDRNDIILTLNNRCSVDWISKQEAVPLSDFSEPIRNKILKGTQDILNKPLQWDIKPTVEFSEYFVAEEIPTDAQHNNIQGYIDSFVSLSTETRYASPMPYFSEKTFKSFYAYRPFILLAPAGTLELIRNLGFKTFGNFWDESYDSEPNHAKRLEKVYKVVDNILSTPAPRLCKMLTDMEDILSHNNHMCSEFNSNMLNYCKRIAPIE
jgi:hypothetical protein